MDVWIADEIERLGIVQNIKSIVIESLFFGIGSFELVAGVTDNNLEILRPGNIVFRNEDITIIEGEETIRDPQIIRAVSREWDAENGFILRVSGRSIKDILSQRIIWNQINEETEALSKVIDDVLQDNIIAPENMNRTINSFSFELPLADMNYITAQLRGENIGDWVGDVCTEYRQGWEIVRIGSTLTMRLVEGADRTQTVIFSPQMNNLISSSTTETTETYRNAALVGGEGEGSEKKTAVVEYGNPEGLDRFEEYIDASNISSNDGEISAQKYEEMLETFGRVELADFQNTREFSVDIDTRGAFQLGTHFFLGDIVRVVDSFGTASNARIISTTTAYEESGNTTTITLETE